MRLALSLLLLALLPAVSPAVSPGSQHGVTWLLQLSDLHLSPHHPQREAALHAFAASLLPRLRPAALLLSGDLVDAKSPSRVSSAQYPAEWAAFDRVRAALLNASQLAAELVLSVRGNHDTFDVPRLGGAGDLYAQHTGEAGRVRRQPVGGGAGGGPRVALLSLDTSLSPGLKRPCNFAGRFEPASAADVRAALARCGPAESGKGCAAASLAFGHFPLSLVDGFGFGHGGVSALGALLAQAGRSERADLAPVAAYLCGHLHWRFGERLHHWHAFPPPRTSHARSAPRSLLELEAGDWKDSRAWRLLAIDSAHPEPTAGRAAQPLLSFRDFRFDQRHDEALVLVTHPPDGRYALEQAGGTRDAPPAFVRALVFPPPGVAAESLRVRASARCAGEELSSVALHLAGGRLSGLPQSDVVWMSPLPSLPRLARACPTPLLLAVTAACGEAENGGEGCAGGQHAHPVAFPRSEGWSRVGAGPRLPMGSTLLARALLSVPIPRAMRLAFWLLFALYLLLSFALPAMLRGGQGERQPASPQTFGALLRAPFSALAERPRLQAAHALYATHLALGPWAAIGAFSGTGEGLRRTALLFATSICTAPSSGGWAAAARRAECRTSMDSLFLTLPQLICVLCPCVALVAVALAAADAAARRGPQSQGGFAISRGASALAAAARHSPLSAAAVGLAAMPLCGVCVTWPARLVEAYGWVAVASPGLALMPPLAVAALAAGLCGVPPARKARAC